MNEVKKTGDFSVMDHLFDIIEDHDKLRIQQITIAKNLGINFTQELTDTKLNSDELKKLQAIYDIFQLALLEEGKERTSLLNEFSILAQQDTYFYNKLIQTAAKTTDNKVDLMDMYNIFNQDFSIVSAKVLIECVKELQNMFTDTNEIESELEKFKNDDFSIPNCTKEQTGLILNGNNELLKIQITAYRKNLQNKIDTEKVNKNQSENFNSINNTGLLNDVKPTEKSSTEYKETLKKKS